jgi:hypothetical protein
LLDVSGAKVLGEVRHNVKPLIMRTEELYIVNIHK